MKFDLKYLKKPAFSLLAEGNSMSPLIRSGDVVFYEKTNYNRYLVNDIVLIKKGGHLLTHRLIYNKGNYFITKGDNNLTSDGKIKKRQIFGKVYKVKRGSKFFNPENLYLAQSTLYFREIIKIKYLFEKHKVNYVFLKGLPLHLYFEKSHPQRIYADCDVLIEKKDYPRVKNIIEKYGYKKDSVNNKPVENNYSKIINRFPVIFDIHLEAAFLMTKFSGLEALYPQKLIDKFTKELLDNNKKANIDNQQFLILNTKYLILYLALHLFHHNFRGSFRYEFLDKVIRHSLRHSGEPFDFAQGKRASKQHLRGEALILPRSHLGRESLASSDSGVVVSRLSRDPPPQNDESLDWQKIQLLITNYQLTNFVYPVFFLLKKYYKTPIPFSFIKSLKPTDFMNFTNLINFKNFPIFDDEPLFQAGINRFRLIFFLSPNPWWKKILVFTNQSVIYNMCQILIRKFLLLFPGSGGSGIIK